MVQYHLPGITLFAWVMWAAGVPADCTGAADTCSSSVPRAEHAAYRGLLLIQTRSHGQQAAVPAGGDARKVSLTTESQWDFEDSANLTDEEEDLDTTTSTTGSPSAATQTADGLNASFGNDTSDTATNDTGNTTAKDSAESTGNDSNLTDNGEFVREAGDDNATGGKDASDEDLANIAQHDPAGTPDVTNTSGNATGMPNDSNISNATGGSASVPPQCLTKEDRRVHSWRVRTSPPGTPCVFGVDPRDEGSHCILDDEKYGSNGWCFTSQDGSSWGSCNENCPLYGQAKVLASEINRLRELLVHSQAQLAEDARPHADAGTNETAPSSPGAADGAPDDDGGRATQVETGDDGP